MENQELRRHLRSIAKRHGLNLDVEKMVEEMIKLGDSAFKLALALDKAISGRYKTTGLRIPYNSVIILHHRRKRKYIVAKSK